MPRDPVHQALREGLEGALKELTALRTQLHQAELTQTRDITEVRTLLNVVMKRLEIERGEPGEVAAAKVTAKGSVNVQLIATIGALATAFGSLIVALLR